MAASCTLLELPLDILISLPDYLRDIEDFVNLSSTCRAFRVCLASTSPHTILHLCAAASRIFFRPSPHLLVAATARQVGAWASLSSANATMLRSAFRDGMDGLIGLALGPARAGLTMERIRELYEMRFATINPIVDLIDKCVGMQWYDTPNFWYGGVDDASTIRADPPCTFFHLAVYGSLFGAAFDTYLETGTVCEAVSVETRLEYVKYCIPDWVCYRLQDKVADVFLKDGTIDPRRAVAPVGPYMPYASGEYYPEGFNEYDNQHSLSHLLCSKTWNPSWTEVRAKVGGDFGQGWRQDLWWSVVMLQGLEGMEMIWPGKDDLWKERLVDWRCRIEAIAEEPRVVKVGRRETHVYPDIRGDLAICFSGFRRDT